MNGFGNDPFQRSYKLERMLHWDQLSQKKSRTRRLGTYYHKLLRHYFRLVVPRGMRVMELGCGQGDLLATLKPSFGLGIDFSAGMLRYAKKKHPGLLFIRADAHAVPLKCKFDIIILSDLVNDLWDVQSVLNQVHRFCHPGTRIVLNFHNQLWRTPLSLAKFLGLGAETLEQNWFSPNDVENLLNLSGLEVITRKHLILAPLRMSFLSGLANRVLVHFVPFKWLALTTLMVARPRPDRSGEGSYKTPSVTVVIPARNEAGNIEDIIRRVPDMGNETELLFVEGHSTDDTYDAIEKAIQKFSFRKCRLLRQKGKGKGDAVRLGFEAATGDVLMILDADMTVPPEDLPRFCDALVGGRGEFINGVRSIYPMQDRSMRFINMVGNKFFSLVFSWLLHQSVKDTLCGTKVLWKNDYRKIAINRDRFGDFDPFGDFDLLFGAAALNMKIADIPIRYRSRTYGDTNIDRWRHGWLLLKMVWFAARRLKFT
jgi:2-polyprenyl-3-methyl-5-hydroxy-6-metoxy-1,4-benzoquinol methylase